MKGNGFLFCLLEPYVERSRESLERSKIAAREYENGKVNRVEQVFNY